MAIHDQFAVVTGASSGIGLGLARQFAAHGFDLLLTAEDDALANAAIELGTQQGVQVQTLRADLRRDEGVEELYAAIAALGRPVDAAALNAGVGRGGAFIDTPLHDQLNIVDLNVRSTVHLAKLMLDDMVGRGAGRLLITSSIASTMPGSFQSIYNASKSFLQSFGEALQNELKDSEVSVTLLMPGPTETEFFDRAQMGDTAVGHGSKDSAEDVARQGFDALMSGKDRVVAASVKTKAQEVANKVIPDKLKAQAHRRMAEPGSGDA